MSLATFEAALAQCVDNGDIPFIGGGEPTLHPEFEKFLMLAIAAALEVGDGSAGIITNGGVTKRAMLIARLTKAGILSGSLSQDYYHDPIEQRVIDAFNSLDSWAKFHDTSNGGQREPLPHGRGLEMLGLDPTDEEDQDAIMAMNDDGSACICTDIFVEPNGEIRQCGCADAPNLGNVRDGYLNPAPGECHRSRWFTDACIEQEHSEYSHLVGV